jgi:hypothetical protein
MELIIVFFPLIVAIAAVVVIAILAAVVAPLRQAARGQARLANLRARAERAVWSSATVASLRNRPAPGTGERRVRVDLRLQVKAPDGTLYAATPSWFVDVDALANLQPGASLSVKIDAEDPAVIYPNAPWAEIWPHD